MKFEGCRRRLCLCLLWPWPLCPQNLNNTSMNPNISVTKIGWNSFHWFLRHSCSSQSFQDALAHRLTHGRTQPKTECLRHRRFLWQTHKNKEPMSTNDSRKSKCRSLIHQRHDAINVFWLIDVSAGKVQFSRSKYPTTLSCATVYDRSVSMNVHALQKRRDACRAKLI